MQIKTLKETLPFLLKANVTPMIIGAHGIGKSEVVRQYAEENGYKFVDIRLGSLSDAGDLMGLPEFVKDAKGNSVATKFMPPAWLPKNGEKCVVFLDEINRAKRDLLQAVFQLVLDKRVGEYQLPAESVVVAAMNPDSNDYTTTDISDKAFMDRFCHIKLTPSKQEFLKYADSKGAPSELVSFFKDQPELLDAKTEDFSLDFVQPSRRSAMALARVMNQNPSREVLTEVARGLLGPVAAAAFVAHLDAQEKPLSASDIFDNLSKHVKTLTKWSDPSKGQPALISSTSDNLVKEFEDEKKTFTKSQLKNISAYIGLIPIDSAQSLCMKVITRPDVTTAIEENEEFMQRIEAYAKTLKAAEALAETEKTTKKESKAKKV